MRIGRDSDEQQKRRQKNALSPLTDVRVDVSLPNVFFYTVFQKGQTDPILLLHSKKSPDKSTGIYGALSDYH